MRRPRVPSSEVCLSSKYGATDNFNRENYQNDPIITKSLTTIVPTSLQKEVDYDFDPYYNNPMDEFDYDWDVAGRGALLRHKATLYNTSSQYINAHILNLFDSGQIYDGSNTLLAKWDQQYDQGTPDPESGIVDYDPSVTPLGNPTTKTNWLNTPTAQDLSTLLTYDIAGNVRKVQDPVGNVSKFSYSDSSNTYANVTEETNALSQVSTWAYDNNIDKPTSAIDPNKIETDYTYSSDPFDRVTAIQKAVGTTAASNINISYIGTTEVDIYSSLDSTSTDQALHTATRYDGFGRGSLNITYESSSSSIATTQNYDALGRLGTTTNPSRPGDGLGYATSRQYDALGRPWSVTTADGAVTCYSYADNQNPSCPVPSGSPAGEWMFVRDPSGNQKQMWTDGLGRLVMVIEDPGATPAHLNYVTTYTYDGLDDLISVSQGAVTRNFAYDSLKRLIAANNPENASAAFPAQLACPGTPTGSVWTTCYSYDNNGNLTTRQDNRNVVTTYKYDELNRLVSKVYTGSAATPSSYFCYDGVHNSAENQICQNAPSAANAIGRLTETYNSNSTTQFTSFDPLGRVLKHSQTTGNYIYNFAYAYNFAGDLTCEQYPSGRLVLTSYDLANRVSQVTAGSGSCDKSSAAALPTYAGGPSSTQTIQYAPHGAPWLYVTGDTVWHAPTYNSRLQVCGLQDVLAGTGTNWSAQACNSAPPVTGGTALLSATLNWGTSNNNGDLQGSSFTYAGNGLSGPLTFTQTYQYDNVNRLISVNDASSACATTTSCYSRSFGYDAFGNMYVPPSTANPPGWTGIAPSGYMPVSATAYNGLNQLNAAAYDAAGNQTKVNGNTLSYDAESRQTAVAYAGATEDYLYDGDGKRVGKTGTGLSTTVFVYDALGRMAAEYSTQTENSPCNTCYLSQDHLGTARMITDQSGNVVARHDYLPFGEEIAANTAGRDSHWGSGNDPINQKFTGKERDSESGLDYFGARYYGSSMGRMMSPDPGNIGANPANPQSWNMYSYSLNNPLSFTDPAGLYVCADSAKCDSANDKAFASALSAARDAANRLTGDDKTAALRGLDAYGEATKDNGVKVGFDSSVDGGLTKVSGVANGNKSDLNPNGQNISVTLNPNFANDAYGGADLVSHEGSHVADGSAWVASGFSSSLDPTFHQGDIDANHVQFNIMNSINNAQTPSGSSWAGAGLYGGSVRWDQGATFKGITPDLENAIRKSYAARGIDDSKPSLQKGSVLPK